MSKGVWIKTKDKLNHLHRAWLDLDSSLLSTQQIAKYIKMDWHTALNYLTKLEKAGLVKRTEIKTSKKRTIYWEKRKRLKEKSAESM